MPEKIASQASLLVSDLSNVPGIIGGLGLSIAAAQKAFNLDYIENIERLLAQAKLLLGDPGADPEKFKNFENFLKEILISLAPSRYQFTETTFTVRMDLAQTLSKSVDAGLGINVGAVAINAAMSSAFGYDYRASAEVRTVLHAVHADPSQVNSLLDRASKLSDKSLKLPERTEVDKEIYKATERIFEKVLEQKPTQQVEDLEQPDGE